MSTVIPGTGNEGGTRLGDPLGAIPCLPRPHHGDGDPEAQIGCVATRQVWAPAGPLDPSCGGQGLASSLSSLCRPALGYGLPHHCPLDTEAHPTPAAGAAAEATGDMEGGPHSPPLSQLLVAQMSFNQTPCHTLPNQFLFIESDPSCVESGAAGSVIKI